MKPYISAKVFLYHQNKDSNFQALFNYLPDDQVKALLQDLWRKNAESKRIDDLTNEIELKLLEVSDAVSCQICLEKFDTEDRQPYLHYHI